LYRGTARLFGIWPPTDMMQPLHAWKRITIAPLNQLHHEWTTVFILPTCPYRKCLMW
jgi:hypothetical protein